MDKIIEAMVREIDDYSLRRRVYASIIPEFTGHDCDTLDECRDADGAFDDALDELESPLDYDDADEEAEAEE